ncbi:MAG: dCTP deaminase [Candidatus Bipolaricaulota bacterium]|nr:dCTP deaminase [Candidatus Bipolaricaulota bacterium]
MVKNDRWIREMAVTHKMIEPFVENQMSKGVISYGLSSYGYDIRIADEFKIFTSVNPDLFATGQPVIVYPKNFNEHSFVDYRGEVCVIPPNSFALGRSVEYFRIPRDIMALCVGKSTYARCGIIVNITPAEPEWEGQLVIEISNTSPLPAKIYANEGIAQMIFLEAHEVCEVSYADRKGKYQKQIGIVTSKVQ